MGIRSILASIFGSGDDEQARDTSSGGIAKNRLTVIVAGDRAGITPAMIDNMKQDIIDVLKRYAEIDESQINISLENEEESMALVAHLPIKTMLRQRRMT